MLLLAVLLALFYACSALKFSRVMRGNCSGGPSNVAVKEMTDTSVKIGLRSTSDISMTLLLADRKLFADTRDYYICIYRNDKIKDCYQNLIQDVGLSSGDKLFLVQNSDKDALSSALNKNPPSASNFTNVGFWRKFAHTKNEFFVVTIEEGGDEPKKDSIDLGLKFSKPVHVHNREAPQTYADEESDRNIEIHSRMGFPIMTALLENSTGTLNVDENSFICIYRDNKLDPCFENVKSKAVKLSLGDMLIFGRKSAKDGVSDALEKNPLSNISSESIDSWLQLFPNNVSLEFFVTSIGKIESQEKEFEDKENSASDSDSADRESPKKRETNDSHGSLNKQPLKKKKINQNHTSS